MKKDCVVQITRIVAMFMIVLCHLVQEFENRYIQMISQFLNVGVFVFIFISGYLYGAKQIENSRKWLVSRFLKIMIPVYIFMIFIFGFEIFVQHNFEIKYVFVYLFDLQFVFGGVQGAQHLWFLTVIMICYMITPLLYKNKEKLLSNYKVILFVIAVLAILLSYVREEIGRTFMYILLYVSAYGYRNRRTDKEKSKILLIFSIIVLFAIRIIARKFCDGTVLYNTIVVCFTQILLTYSMYWLLDEVFKNVEIKNNAILNHFDTISYYVYITHYMFMVGPVRTMGMTQNMMINSGISVLLSWGTALILYQITNLRFHQRKDFEHGKN